MLQLRSLDPQNTPRKKLGEACFDEAFVSSVLFLTANLLVDGTRRSRRCVLQEVITILLREAVITQDARQCLQVLELQQQPFHNAVAREPTSGVEYGFERPLGRLRVWPKALESQCDMADRHARGKKRRQHGSYRELPHQHHQLITECGEREVQVKHFDRGAWRDTDERLQLVVNAAWYGVELAHV